MSAAELCFKTLLVVVVVVVSRLDPNWHSIDVHCTSIDWLFWGETGGIVVDEDEVLFG